MFEVQAFEAWGFEVMLIFFYNQFWLLRNGSLDMFIVQACYYFGNFEIQVWQIPCICNVLQSTAAVFMQYVKTYFRTFQYNIFLHKYYCRLFVPNQRTQFYLKRLLTYVLLAANLISNYYSIRTAYYAVTKKRDRAVQIPWSQSRRLPQMHV